MIDAHAVHGILDQHQLADGLEIVLDLDRSHGVWIYDARTDSEFLDAFTCFASWPVGYNHPMLDEPAFVEELARVARHKPSNSDLYTVEMARFVNAFATDATPEGFDHHFWVSGGALAVENGLKAAFDWKARKLGRTQYDQCVNDLVILHFTNAFHGRSGYTMSLTNTVPDKIGLYPKFDWPRVHSPAMEFDLDGNVSNDIEAEEARACAEIEAAFKQYKGRVAAILIEPMQGEGGDRHFRPEFLAKLRAYAQAEEALLIYDEVQTGFFGSGEPWLWQTKDVAPDIVCFGKKTQVCGVYAGPRLDEVESNVFRTSSRINSTWGGNLVDMVRCRQILEIFKKEDVLANVRRIEERTLDGLRSIARETGAFANVRGAGSLIAFSFDTSDARDRMIAALYDKKVICLASGSDSVRFRLPLTMTADEIDSLLERTAMSVPAAVG